MSSEKGKKIIIKDRLQFRFHKMLRNDVQRWNFLLGSVILIPVSFFLNYLAL
jgi:hypothetical protein